MGSTPHLMLFRAGTVIPTGSRMHGRCRLGCSSSEDGRIQLFRHRDTDPSVEDNPLVAAARRVLPLSGSYRQGRIVTRVDGDHAFTPLFLGTSQSPSSPGR